MAAPGPSDMDIPTICFGFTLGFLTLTGSSVCKQSLSVYRRKGNVWSIYLFMIWAELLVNLTWAILVWLFLRGDIKPSLGFYLGLVMLWTVQTQCLIQIIANRVSLVMTVREHARRLKLGLLIAVAFINISVYCVWIPARMEVSPTFVHVNEIWDRIEKVLYLIIDFGLNAYFLWLVRSKLIDRGLTKYMELFRFNAGIVVISIAMDALILGMMSLPNTMVYTQFHPLAYVVKLNIELNMADLISKVVRKKDRTDRPHDHDSSSNPSKGTELTSKTRTNNRSSFHKASGTVFQISSAKSPQPHQDRDRKREGDEEVCSESSSESGINFVVPERGIVKTVKVETVADERDAGTGRERDVERGSTSSSTARLHAGEYDYLPRGYR